MMTSLLSRQFEEIKQFEFNKKGYKPKNKILTAVSKLDASKWFLKIIASKHSHERLFEAVIDVALSNLYRLFVTINYPKASFISEVTNELGETICVIGTKAVPKFMSPYLLDTKSNLESLTDNLGLANIVILSLYFAETDLSPFNIGLSGKNVIKIDHGSCLLSLWSKSKYRESKTITKEDLENPFMPKHYQAYHWLNYRVAGKINHTRHIQMLYEEYNRLTKIEQYKQILKILIMPDTLLRQVLLKSVDKKYEHIVTKILITLQKRRHDMMTAALRIESFRKFVLTLKIEEIIDTVFEKDSLKEEWKSTARTNFKKLVSDIHNSLFIYVNDIISELIKRSPVYSSKGKLAHETFEKSFREIQQNSHWSHLKKELVLIFIMLKVFKRNRHPTIFAAKTPKSYDAMLSYLNDFIIPRIKHLDNIKKELTNAHELANAETKDAKIEDDVFESVWAMLA